MEINALGYIGLNSDKLEDWTDYATSLIGFEVVDKARSSLAFRMDDRKQRIFISAESDARTVFGWEVSDADALDRLAARLEAAGHRVARLPLAVTEQRRVAAAIAFDDPSGNRLEAFYGPETTTKTFKPSRAISGFRTGPLGMGHIALTVERLQPTLEFYRDVLRFKMSDYFLKPFPVYFFHVNPRHHSLGLVETGTNGIHHMMVELYNFDDVGQGWDIAQTKPEQIATTLGRHVNDLMTSFYTWSPSKFLVEYGWGGRSVGDDWKVGEVTQGPSIWGHDRMWLPPEKRVEARQMRMANAAAGWREPVHVLDGNFELEPGRCPWWDSIPDKSHDAWGVN
jgi:2,3-dihydroxybiphenyl 1,2-dioxygenase